MERQAEENKRIYQRGFSTLFIVILLGSIVLALSAAFATSSVLTLRGSLNTEQSARARAAANACAEVALETIKFDPSYTGAGAVLVDSYECAYDIQDQGSDNRVINTFAEVEGVVRRVRIQTNSFNPLALSVWEEI